MDLGLSLRGVSIATSKPATSSSVSPSVSLSPRRNKPVVSSPTRTPQSSKKVVPPTTSSKIQSSSSPSTTTTTASVEPLQITTNTETIVATTTTTTTSELPSPPPPPPPILSTDDGSVRIKFNHYLDSFTIVQGKLSSNDIAEKYCFGFVYKGHYKLHLLLLPGKTERVIEEEAPSAEVSASVGAGEEAITGLLGVPCTFKGLRNKETYLVEIEEDAEEIKLLAAREPKTLDAQELTRLRMAAEFANKQQKA